MISNVNPFTNTIQNAAERLRGNPSLYLSIRISGDVVREGRQYNAPACAEVAVIIPDDDENIDTAAMRELLYITKDGELRRINETHAYYDPLHYVLHFPRGELGWTVGIQQHIDIEVINENRYNDGADAIAERIQGEEGGEERDDINDEDPVEERMSRIATPRQFYVHRIMEREESYNHYYGRLFLAFIADMYAKVESSRLRFIRREQGRFQTDVLRGAADAVYAADIGNNDAEARQIGRRVILPSSFPGGPRYMHQNFQDAMAIVRAIGKPDLFISFTCNPNWKERFDLQADFR